MALQKVDAPVKVTQWIDENGHPTRYFHQLIHDLWKRTGGSDDSINITQDVWTPDVSFVTPGDLAILYSTQSGDYIKIDKLVLAAITLDISSFTHTTASGNLKITGLPFTIRSSWISTYTGALVHKGITKASYTDFVLSATSNNDFLLIECSGSAQPHDTVDAADVPTGEGKYFAGSVLYFTD